MTKRKVGRNDPCPCGSGKKYKNCCLLWGNFEKPVPEILFTADSASLRMNYLLSNMGLNEFFRAYKGPAMAVEKSVMATLPASPSKRESEKALLLWKDKIEEEIERLCSNHSKYYWLFLLRRIFPETTEPYDRPTTPYLHRTSFNLAVLKYGNSNQVEEFVTVPGSFDMEQYISTEEPYNGETIDSDAAGTVEIGSGDELREVIRPSIIPRQITRKDAINIYQIEYLALEYYSITALLRRFWKGGKLKVHGGKYAGVHLPQRVENLVALYDDRQSRYSELLSSFGSITSLDKIKEKDNRDDFMLFVPFPNIEKYKIPLVFPGEEFFGGRVKGPIYTEGNPCNFVPCPVSLRPCYEKMCMFRQAIKGRFDLSPEELVAFIIALARHNEDFWLCDLQSRYNFFQRGYTLMPSTEDFRQYLEKVYRSMHKNLFGDITPEQTSQSCGRLLDWMTYDEDDFKAISLWDRTGAKLVLPVSGGFLTDHSAIPAVLASIFSELSLLASGDGEIGQIRGDDFQNEVEKHLNTNITDAEPWICHRKLQFLSRLKRDIDVSLCSSNVLFVVECKAFGVPPAFDRGEPAALGTRKEKLDAALDQVDGLCELLSMERKGRNFELPAKVTHIVSIVASPFPEYVASRGDRYFLTPSIPRVCTPEEIVEFIRRFRLSTFLHKPFVWEIS